MDGHGRRILSVSKKTRLRITRDDTLAVYGYTVVSPRTPLEAPDLMRQDGIEAVVIGQSVEPDERKRLIAAIREVRPDCPIVFVYFRPEDSDEPLADERVDITDGLLLLLESLDRVIRARGRDTGRAA